MDCGVVIEGLRRGRVGKWVLATCHFEAETEVVSESPKATVKGWGVG